MLYALNSPNIPSRLKTKKAYKIAKELDQSTCFLTGIELVFEDWRAAGKAEHGGGIPHPRQANLDHLVPRSAHRSNGKHNIVVVCHAINSAFLAMPKHAKLKVAEKCKNFMYWPGMTEDDKIVIATEIVTNARKAYYEEVVAKDKHAGRARQKRMKQSVSVIKSPTLVERILDTLWSRATMWHPRWRKT